MMKKSIKKELIKGEKAELKEHKKTIKGSKKTALKIAKDHVLGEKMPKYYEELDKMEKKAKKPKKTKKGKK